MWLDVALRNRSLILWVKLMLAAGLVKMSSAVGIALAAKAG